jgi:hypothetical protein
MKKLVRIDEKTWIEVDSSIPSDKAREDFISRWKNKSFEVIGEKKKENALITVPLESVDEKLFSTENLNLSDNE